MEAERPPETLLCKTRRGGRANLVAGEMMVVQGIFEAAFRRLGVWEA